MQYDTKPNWLYSAEYGARRKIGYYEKKHDTMQRIEARYNAENRSTRDEIGYAQPKISAQH